MGCVFQSMAGLRVKSNRSERRDQGNSSLGLSSAANCCVTLLALSEPPLLQLKQEEVGLDKSKVF